MRTRYEFIHFNEVPRTKQGGTKIWDCCNNRSGDYLGHVRWYFSWRQYCFVPLSNCVFSQGCLDDLATFIKEAMAEHRAAKGEG